MTTKLSPRPPTAKTRVQVPYICPTRAPPAPPASLSSNENILSTRLDCPSNEELAGEEEVVGMKEPSESAGVESSVPCACCCFCCAIAESRTYLDDSDCLFNVCCMPPPVTRYSIYNRENRGFILMYIFFIIH